jgi:hypothetical protein
MGNIIGTQNKHKICDELNIKDHNNKDHNNEDVHVQSFKNKDSVIDENIDLRNEINVLKNIINHKENQLNCYTDTIRELNDLHDMCNGVIKSHLKKDIYINDF